MQQEHYVKKVHVLKLFYFYALFYELNPKIHIGTKKYDSLLYFRRLLAQKFALIQTDT